MEITSGRNVNSRIYLPERSEMRSKEAYAEGYAEGVRIVNVRTIRNLAKKNISISLTAEILDVTEEFVKGVLAATTTEIE